MNNPIFTEEQRMIIEVAEYKLSEIKEQDILYNTMRELIYTIPNNYELGVAIRQLFT